MIGYVFAVGTSEDGLEFFSALSYFSFSLSLGDGLIKTELPSQRAVKLKTTNHAQLHMLS